MALQIFPLSSELHDEGRLEETYRPFIEGLEKEMKEPLRTCGSLDEKSDTLTVFLIKTGGVEEKFRAIAERCRGPFLLLAGSMHNSLAASCEILCWLKAQGMRGEIIHGSPGHMAERLRIHRSVYLAGLRMSRARLGVIGRPSPWLIASTVNYRKAREMFGVELVDIPVGKYLERIGRCGSVSAGDKYGLEERAFDDSSLPPALDAYLALKSVVDEYGLDGLTLRCFDMLESVRTTGCIALSLLNSEGKIAACEGDVPALISMAMISCLTGGPVFMANPCQIDIDGNSVVLAHCTVPLSMVKSYRLDTHFESGIGAAVAGDIASGPATVFRLSSDFRHYFLSDGEITESLRESTLCRTQIRLHIKEDVRYFLSGPLGNHHLICRGAESQLIRCLLENMGEAVPVRYQ